MLTYAVEPRTRAQLSAMVTPPANASEATPAELYDQATYTDNTTTRLEFYNETRANRNLSNGNGSGQLPADQFFEAAFLQVGIFVPPAATLAVAADLWNLIAGSGAATGAPICFLELNDKTYGPWTLARAAAPWSGIQSDTTTTATDTSAQNAWACCGGGIWLDQQIVIPPVTRFVFVIQWAAPVDIAADVQIRPTFVGTRHRRVQ